MKYVLLFVVGFLSHKGLNYFHEYYIFENWNRCVDQRDVIKGEYVSDACLKSQDPIYNILNVLAKSPRYVPDGMEN